MPKAHKKLTPGEKSHRTIGRLLELAADYEETAEEAEADLRAMGVDVDGFLARVEARVKKVAEERLVETTRAFVHELAERCVTGVVSVGMRRDPAGIIVYMDSKASLKRALLTLAMPCALDRFRGIQVLFRGSGPVIPA